ncbi:MAG: hypothetical protein D3925_00545, partial [Candidatus Electrothrix sp. AR5]|nr:hypothetical protein [Candidatus Electrothrix sp. AR5]
MNSSLGSEIVTGFIGEVEGYLPDMSRCLETLQQDRAHRPSLAELHRITHTIKGAAAMVGLDDLSGIGEVLEKVMENVLGASLTLDDETITLLGDATRRIDSYCMMQRTGRPDDGQLFQETVAEIEEKLCKSTVASDEMEGGSESCNPETILFEENEESVEEELSFETTPDALNNELGLPDDFFADAGNLFDEISSPVPPAEEALEDELLFKDVAEEEDDLFGSPVAAPVIEQFDLPGTVFPSSGIEQTEQTGPEKTGVEGIDPELLECFREETGEHLENIDDCLNSLGVQVTDSVELTSSTQETLHSLRRSVHTLKGAAAVIGIEQIAAWGHDFEDFLDWLHDEARKLDPATVAALRDGADLLASLAEEPTRPVEKEKQRITAKFVDITEAFSSGAAGTISEDDKGEEAASSLGFDEAENALGLSQESPNCEEAEEADSFFDEFASSVPAAENVEDELLFQDVAEEEDDLFDSPGAAFASGGIEQTEQTGPEKTGVEGIDPELLECFREETEEHLENIDDCLNSLGVQVTDSVELTSSTQETLHSLRRSVHTLKGAAAVIGIEQIAAWGH